MPDGFMRLHIYTCQNYNQSSSSRSLRIKACMSKFSSSCHLYLLNLRCTLDSLRTQFRFQLQPICHRCQVSNEWFNGKGLILLHSRITWRQNYPNFFDVKVGTLLNFGITTAELVLTYLDRIMSLKRGIEGFILVFRATILRSGA